MSHSEDEGPEPVKGSGYSADESAASPEAPEGEIAYQSVNGTAYPESKTVIFDVANATAGTMKRRGRKKAA